MPLSLPRKSRCSIQGLCWGTRGSQSEVGTLEIPRAKTAEGVACGYSLPIHSLSDCPQGPCGQLLRVPPVTHMLMGGLHGRGRGEEKVACRHGILSTGGLGFSGKENWSSTLWSVSGMGSGGDMGRGAAVLYPGTFTGSHIIILMTLAPCTRACEHHPSKHPWGQNRDKEHDQGPPGSQHTLSSDSGCCSSSPSLS